MTDRPFRRLKVFVLVAAWVTLLVMTSSVFLERVEYLLSDRLLVLHAHGNQPDDRIVIVDIDDYSIQAMSGIAGRWPWPRSVHAELIERLHAAGARLLVFDLLFSEADLYRADDDAYFAEAVESTSAWLPSLLLESADHGRGTRLASVAEALGATPGPAAEPDARAVLLLPEVVRRESWNTGLINVSPDSDGVTRRYPIWLNHAGWRIPSLSARLTEFLGLAVPEKQYMTLNWQGDYPHVYKTYPYADIYSGLLHDASLAELFRDRIVLIGLSAAGLHDVHVTPIHPTHLGPQILAATLDNLLNGESLTPTPWYAQMWVGLLMICILAWISSRTRSIWVIFCATLVLSLMVVALSYSLLSFGWVLPVTLALLSSWAYMILAEAMKYWQEREEKQRALELFGRFLDPVMVEALAKSGSTESLLDTKSLEITVLFADIRNFTGLSEEHAPEVVMAMLNHFYSRQIEIVFQHKGTLDKFIGDTLMAFWGAPLDNPDHAADAVRAALAMSQAVADICKEGRYQELDIGIGVHTGVAMVGMVGSERRYDYTVIGDTVNLASRIEGQTKGRARILVSAATRDACAGQFQFRDHGRVQVRGREEDVHVYEPIEPT